MSRLARLGNAVKLPFLAIGKGYNSVAERHPFTTGIVTTVIKTSAADLFAQKVVEGREEIEWKRHSMFCLFGFAYLGCFQYYLYNNLFSRICGPITRAFGHAGSAPVKTFIDQCIHHPFIYFPSFYLLKGYVEGRTVDMSLTRCREDIWDNCVALWKIWVPAQLINFAVVPRHLRIPFVALVSFAWTVVISVMRGTINHHSDDGEPSSPSAASLVSSVASSAASTGLQPLLATAAKAEGGLEPSTASFAPASSIVASAAPGAATAARSGL